MPLLCPLYIHCLSVKRPYQKTWKIYFFMFWWNCFWAFFYLHWLPTFLPKIKHPNKINSLFPGKSSLCCIWNNWNTNERNAFSTPLGKLKYSLCPTKRTWKVHSAQHQFNSLNQKELYQYFTVKVLTAECE